jgi:FMN-dependent oxidoreductase (nitrilotriacetate monooxygenase family)
MTKQIHLVSFLIHSPVNHLNMSWTDAGDRRLEMMGDVHLWQDYAKLLERGMFDGLFFADTPGVLDRYRDTTDIAVRHGVCWPNHDPTVLLSALVAATTHLGFAATVSTGPNHPYNLVRQLSTLDYLSGGRIGWNIVTGHLRGEHRAYGLPELGHDERYERAEEYMEVCHALWNSIGDGAIVADKQSGILADTAKVSRIKHSGKYFECWTVSPAWPSPQRRPVLFQAGSSGRGQRFAAKHADLVFAVQPRLEGMKKFMTEFREVSLAETGAETPVSFGIQPVIAGTEEEAHAKLRAYKDKIPIEVALARLGGTLGIDFDGYDLDQPLKEMTTDASQGLMRAMTSMMEGDGFTLREAALHYSLAMGMPQLVGTPEQVADQMEHIWCETGCLAFNVTPTINPGSVEDFVDQVVPILQRRGVYRTEYTGRTFRENLGLD